MHFADAKNFFSEYEFLDCGLTPPHDEIRKEVFDGLYEKGLQVQGLLENIVFEWYFRDAWCGLSPLDRHLRFR